MKIILAAVMLYAGNSFATRYAVIFKDVQNFNQLHSQWVLNDVGGLKKTFASPFSDYQIQASLVHVQTMVISTSRPHWNTGSGFPSTVVVEKEYFHPAPELFRNESLTPHEFSSAWKFLSTSGRAKSQTFAAAGVPWGVAAVRAPEAWALGDKGLGSRVMVLDTGIDQFHPAIEGQMEEMKDFVGDGNTPYPAADHLGHGTHVSGIILGRELSSGFSGVAPLSMLLIGRVCSENGCSSIHVTEGINWAIEKKVDVLNLSLGSDVQTSVEKEALARAEAAGVIVVAASGNGGKNSVGFPAAFPGVLAVGAIDLNFKRASFSQWGPELAVVAPGVEIRSSVPKGTGCRAEARLSTSSSSEEVVSATCFLGSSFQKDLQKEIIPAGFGKPNEFSGQDFTGHFALINRGEISFTEKVSNALAAHVAGVILVNNQPGLLTGGATDDGSLLSIPVIMLEQVVGEKIEAQLAQGKQSVSIKIQTSADDYSSFSGTSMACPHVSGTMALIRSAKKSISPEQARNILKSTATPLNPSEESGAGLINAEKAVAKALEIR